MKKITTTLLALITLIFCACSSSSSEDLETKTFTTLLSQTSLGFGNVEVAQTMNKNFTVTNTGTEEITISNITTPQGFTINTTSGSIVSGASKTFTVSFTPTTISTYNGNLSITSNSTSTATIINVTGTGIASTSAKTYENTIAPIMAQSCSTTGCHSGNNPAGQVALTNFTEVKNGFIIDDSWGEIVSGRMPKAGVPSLTQDDKDNLQLWINTGYPSGELVSVTYTSNIAPLINQSCATTNCHGGSRSPSLTNYSEVKTAFEATGANSSIGRIERGNMPKNSSKLADEKINLIKTWIETGFLQ